MRTEDDLRAVFKALERHVPDAERVLSGARTGLRMRTRPARHPLTAAATMAAAATKVRRAAGWLLPLTAAASVAAIVVAAVFAGHVHRTTVVSKALSPQQRARAEAASILAAFVPPPGAQRLARPPGGVGGDLDHPPGYLGDSDVVYSATLWAVQGMSTLQALAWEKAHLPSQFKMTGTGDEAAQPGWGDAYDHAYYEFDVAGLPTVLPYAEMDVQAARSLTGQTYVRVDAGVAWQPQRLASERVPAGVGAITITLRSDRPPDVPAPVTVSDPAKVDKIVRLIDSLPVQPPGGLPGCLAESGGITLSFRSHANGPALATASETIPDCGGVQFAIRGTSEPPLMDSGSFAQKVLSIAGVRWPGSFAR